MNKNNNDIQSVYEMSLTKKLFMLREAIDLAKQGIQPNLEAMDICFEDVNRALMDYEFILEDLENAQSQLQEQADEVVGGTTTIITNGGGAFMDPNIKEALATDKTAKQQFGKDYINLLAGLDKINEDDHRNLTCYISPSIQNPNKMRLRIWDEREAFWIRNYEDEYELSFNLKQDLQTVFERKKTELPESLRRKVSDKKMSTNKKDNKER